MFIRDWGAAYPDGAAYNWDPMSAGATGPGPTAYLGLPVVTGLSLLPLG